MNRSSTPAQSTQKRRSPKNPPAPPQAASEPQISSADPDAAAVRFVGLDVHKKQIPYCILDRDGATIREGEIVLNRTATHSQPLPRRNWPLCESPPPAKNVAEAARAVRRPLPNCWAAVSDPITG